MTDTAAPMVLVEVILPVLPQEVELGIPGPPGQPGGTLSTDPENRARAGTDGGLHVPEWEGTDPLAYYVLKRS